jgi:Ca2+-binding RTX toxin-like protein
MSINVTIKQSIRNFSTFSLLDPSPESAFNLLLEAEKTTGSATAATLALTDSDYAGYTVSVTGSDLTYDSAGRIEGGNIAGMVFQDAGGKTVGSIAADGASGLDLAVQEVANVSRNPEGLNTLLANWVVEFDATAVPSTDDWLGGGVEFEAGAGADSLVGSKFNDFLYGGAGNDMIDGGDGNDLLVGDETPRLMTDSPGGKDVLKGGEGDDELRGNGGNDLLYGGNGGDILRGDDLGEKGNDKLYGQAGSDTLSGGEGNDRLDGGKDQDRVQIQDMQTGDQIFRIDLKKQIAMGQGTDKLVSIEHATGGAWHDNIIIGSNGINSLLGGNRNDTLNGLGGSDRIYGGDGNDRIVGGAANDLIAGSEGKDVLTGNAGKDVFVFSEVGSDHADRISDFSSKDDTIYLNNKAAYGLYVPGTLAEGAFKVLGSSALDDDDRVLYDKKSGSVYFDRDGDGSSERELIFTVKRDLKLTADDFEIRPDITIYSFF